MAKSIIDLTRGIPTTTKGWLDVFGKINRFLRVSGDELVIGGDIALPAQSVGTTELEDGAVTDEKLRNSQACSVMGRSVNSAGRPTDIQATVNGHFLRRAGDVLNFGALVDGDIPSSIARDSEVTSAVATAIATHESALDPHPQYLTQTEGDARYSQFSSGSFTATLTGCTTSPTGTCKYVQVGQMVVIYITTITGTSNTTAATLTGVPVAIRPVTAQTFIARTVDNGVSNVSRNVINTDGTITLGPSISGVTFTNSGTKGFGDTVFAYLLT